MSLAFPPPSTKTEAVLGVGRPPPSLLRSQLRFSPYSVSQRDMQRSCSASGCMHGLANYV